jgi:hypothetical protein
VSRRRWLRAVVEANPRPCPAVVDELVGGDIGREAVDEAVIGELEQLDVHAVGSDERVAGP